MPKILSSLGLQQRPTQERIITFMGEKLRFRFIEDPFMPYVESVVGRLSFVTLLQAYCTGYQTRRRSTSLWARKRKSGFPIEILYIQVATALIKDTTLIRSRSGVGSERISKPLIEEQYIKIKGIDASMKEQLAALLAKLARLCGIVDTP